MDSVVQTEGRGPLMLAFPHSGTLLPPGLFSRLNTLGQRLGDTDWYLDPLFAGLVPDAGTLKASFHRYAIDLNRDPADLSLYPGQNTTGLMPLTDYDGRPIWIAGGEPTDAERHARLDQFHAPYHVALTRMLARIRERHGVAILVDCHSIRRTVPYLFEGDLPDISLGTFDGKSVHPRLRAALEDRLSTQSEFSFVLDGRFKGGWTTRHYGQPDHGVHAFQIELCQDLYCTETPDSAAPQMGAPRLEALRTLLADLLALASELAPWLKP